MRRAKRENLPIPDIDSIPPSVIPVAVKCGCRTVASSGSIERNHQDDVAKFDALPKWLPHRSPDPVIREWDSLVVGA